jgi:hypothetical protein
VPLEMDGMEWHARPVLDEVDRSGIPNLSGMDFEGIKYIDYVCSRDLMGIEIANYRQPFMSGGMPWEKAMTAFRVGNSIVVNRSCGYHPDSRTTVLTKVEEEPEKRIVDRFGKYYCKEPRIVRAQVSIGIDLD